MPPALDALQPGDFAALDNADPPLDLLLIGTGAQLRRPARAMIEAMNARGIGVEPMDSRAAARTYNLLAGAGRDRKSVAKGKSVLVRVALGGRSIITKKKKERPSKPN